MAEEPGIVITDVQCYQVYRLGCFVVVICHRHPLANSSRFLMPKFFVHLHMFKQQPMLKHHTVHRPTTTHGERHSVSCETSLSSRNNNDIIEYTPSYLESIQGILSLCHTHS